jgi:predicted metal-dependent phosphoesterase TrpH
MFGDWLLCDFHIHTRFSDGELTLKEVIDLYGQKEFDVIAVTDHILNAEIVVHYRKLDKKVPGVTEDQFDEYIETLWEMKQKAWKKYKMIVIPGAEVTNDVKKYHILGIDLKKYVSPDAGVKKIVKQIHKQGGIAIACHPHQRQHIHSSQTYYLWENHEKYASVFDAWEVANRDDLFNVIGLKKFNYIANSDFHKPRHLYSWKTLLKCEKNTEAIKSAIRDNRLVAVYLFRNDKREKG